MDSDRREALAGGLSRRRPLARLSHRTYCLERSI